MRPVRHYWEIARDNSLLMVGGAVVALIWANLSPDSYAAVTRSLHFVVNDVAMVFFFGLAVKEIIEATAPGGALHSFRRAAVPVLAAVGGMAAPAAVYASLAMGVGRPDLLPGWAIPCATDIAFSYLVARFVFGPSHPAVPFLLLLAIADDALGLVLLAAFYPSAPVALLPLVGLLVAACVTAWVLRARRTRSFWPYVLVSGGLSWAGLFYGGLHPALALVPILPFVPHAKRDPGLFVDPARPLHDPLSEFERWWSTPVEVVLFFFALVNAGVPIGGVGSVTWIVLAALLIGKPIGIVATTWLAERVGLQRPHGLSWSDAGVAGVAAGIGFTVALFFTTASFPAGPTLDAAKLGALLSVSAAVVAIACAKLLRVGRLKNA